MAKNMNVFVERETYEKNGKKSLMARCYKDVIRLLYKQYKDELTAEQIK